MREDNQQREEILNNNLKAPEPEHQVEQNINKNEKIIRTQKIFLKKNKDQNNIGLKSVEAELKFSDDDLEHPIPLVSDYYEEGKEDIRINFIKNKLKEEKNKKSEKIEEKKEALLNNDLLDEDNKKIYLRAFNKKEKNFEIPEISSKIQNPPIGNKGLEKNIKPILLDDNPKNKKEKNIKNSNIKKINEKDNKFINGGYIKFEKSLKPQINKKQINNNIYNENINITNNSDAKKNSKNQYINPFNNVQQTKNKKINKNKLQKSKNLANNLQQKNQINKNQPKALNCSNIVQQPKQENKPINSKNNLQKIISNCMNKDMPQYSNDINQKIYNQIPSNNLINKVQQSMNYYDNKLIYNKEVNNEIHNEKEFNNPISIQNINDNKSLNENYNNIQKYYNNYNLNNMHNNNPKQQYSVGYRFISNVQDKNSHSYIQSPIKKVYINPQSNNNIYLEEEKDLKVEKNIRAQSNVENYILPSNIQIQNIKQSKSNENTMKNNEKNIINKIMPIQINNQRYTNNPTIKKEIKRNISPNNHFYEMSNDVPFPKNYINIENPRNNLNNKNMHLNNNFFNNNNERNQQLGQGYSNYRNTTYEKGIDFNNIQTTYIVIPKNSNSKLSLIPKPNKKYQTINYESNSNNLSQNSSLIHNSPKYYQQGLSISYLNTDQNLTNIQNYHYFSPYIKNSRFVQKFPLKNGQIIRNYKSQNFINVKNDKDYNYQNENRCNNYGMNYRNYMKIASNNNKKRFNNNNSIVESYYLSNKSSNEQNNQAGYYDTYDYNYNYKGNNASEAPYISYPYNKYNY